MSVVTVGQNGPFGLSNPCLQIWQALLDSRTGAVPLQTAASGGTPVNGSVGQIGPFGMSDAECLKQILQILVDARSGAAPLISKSV